MRHVHGVAQESVADVMSGAHFHLEMFGIRLYGVSLPSSGVGLVAIVGLAPLGQSGKVMNRALREVAM